jgi:hypothetical protein
VGNGSILFVVFLTARLTTVLEAQVPQLDIKSGLWEVTTTAQIRGRIPIDSSQMTPEMKSLVEEATKKVTGETYANVTKECINKEWLARWSSMENDPPGLACKQTPTSDTAASLGVTITCAGESVSVSQRRLDALSTSSFKGLITSSCDMVLE